MAQILEPLAERHGDKPALIDQRGQTSWIELNDRVNRVITILRELDVNAGDTVAVMARNRRELIELTFAALHSSLRIVMVNWHWVADELAYVLDDCGASVLFVDSANAEVAVAALEMEGTKPPLVALDRGEAAIAAAEISLPDRIDGTSPMEPPDQAIGAPMFYTSGTTGRPKGVRSSMIPVGEDLALLELLLAGFQQQTELPSDGVSLLCGPYYHSAQWVLSTLPVAFGSQLVIQDAFDPAEVLTLIDEHRVTNLHLVPTQFIGLLQLPESIRSGFDGSSLSAVLHGAAPCRPAVKRSMIDWWGPAITEYYGGTESGFLTTIRGEEWLEHPGSVGQSTSTVELTVRDEESRPAESGQVGQIWFRSLMGTDFEYHNDASKTAAAHSDDGFATLGDVGYIDTDGYVYLTDRKIDMIVSGGVNIYPAEIETVLADHEAVVDVAVFGIPDEEMGESVKAAVQLADGISPDERLEAELVAFVQQRLARYKAPRSIDIHDELPRHDTGKLLKRELRDPYWADQESSI